VSAERIGTLGGYGRLVPEGHTIHRLAADIGRDLADGPVVATSPQGRFDLGAAAIDGQRSAGAEAWGKHLFCRWEGGEILHVHLGLIGKLRPVPAATQPSPTVRLRLESRDVAWQLTGPQTCAIITPSERDEVVDDLGPDPLRRGGRRRDRFVEGLLSTRRPLGAALLDQSIVAGIGNVYRAELLFLLGVRPTTSASDLSTDQAERLWDTTVEALRRGRSWNRIVTVAADDVGRRVTRRLPAEDSLYVYKRGGLPCRRCGEPVAAIEVAGRSTWYCPSCQGGG
jgi:formamidopyrimidine-DNA glycosylase